MLYMVCLSLAFRVVSNSFHTPLAVTTGRVATSPLYTIPHLVRQMKYNVMWFRVLCMVSMEVSLLVTLQSTDLRNDGRITVVESPVLPPFGEYYVADLSGPFATMDHVSDGFVSYATAHACGAACVPMHSGGN